MLGSGRGQFLHNGQATDHGRLGTVKRLADGGEKSQELFETPNQPTSFTTSGALLAKNVSGCSFSYDAQVITQRAGLVSAWLQVTQSNESVSLYYEVHVSNVP